ncbi:MAG: diguanylate cyclase [Devosia sp.]|uniref:GGDEF domain-containing protein n=1 Tax=Devosia sp. TaxID=1871048 RepID=UPI002611C4AB|nr:GGDEF domain-containing protein [Devosia sp.]MDB5538393.1 diguanylate cyclase [Devosia sp.]
MTQRGSKVRPVDAVGDDLPLPDPRRLMIISVISVVALFVSVIVVVFYSVQSIDRAGIAGEIERAGVALQVVGEDPVAAERLRSEFLLAGAHFAAPGTLSDSEVSVPVPGRHDQVLAWTPVRIGTALFLHLAPLRVGACALFLFGIALALRRLYDLTRELERRRRDAQDLAARDSLTGLANRLAFDEWLGRAAGDPIAEVGLLYLDLDNFKQINDSLGHGAGDELLKVVASRLSGLAKPEDLVARIGGDEFAVVRKGPQSRAELAELAADIGAALSEPIRLGINDLAIGASVGIATGRASDKHLIDAADAALYRAKALPGHAFVFADAAPLNQAA